MKNENDKTVYIVVLGPNANICISLTRAVEIYTKAEQGRAKMIYRAKALAPGVLASEHQRVKTAQKEAMEKALLEKLEDPDDEE